MAVAGTGQCFPSILVVDGDCRARSVLAGLLTACGAQRIVEATDGATALAILGGEAAPPAGIFFALRMAPMDGIEFLSRLRSGAVDAQAAAGGGPLASNAFAVAVADTTARRWVDEASEVGADGCLTKPVRRRPVALCLRQMAAKLAAPAPPGLHFWRLPFPGYVRYELSGRFNVASRPTARRILAALSEDAAGCVVWDVGGIDSLDEHAYGLLAIANGMVCSVGGRFAVISDATQGRTDLSGVGLDRVFPVFPNLAVCMEGFVEGSGGQRRDGGWGR